MKKFLLATTATIILAVPALAADLPVKAPPPMAVAPLFNWTGFYVGGNIGYGWGDVDVTNRGPNVFFAPVGNTHSLSPDGWLGGGQIGFNWQTGQVVFGIEGMLAGLALKESKTGCLPNSTDICEAKVSNLYSITGRLGYDAGVWLPYIKGGFAGARIRTVQSNPGVVTSETTNRFTGWTIGGGAEYMLTRNWTVGLEYNYYALSDKDVTYPRTTGTIENLTIKPNIHSLALRANYKF